MLFLIFQLGRDRYAIEARRVIEVLPLVNLKQIPAAPRGVAGLFNYRGHPVPAVDLSELALGAPSAERLSTRIILVNHPDGAGRNRPLGLIAEHATQIISRARNDFTEPALKLSPAPYLGPVLMDARGMIQWINERRLLPNEVRDALFHETMEQSP